MTNQRCSARVRSVAEFRVRQCVRKGVFYEGGCYWCGQHIPSVVAVRKAKSHARLVAKYKDRRDERRAKEFHDALVQIVTHPIAGFDTNTEALRIIARAALAKMEEGE